MLLTTRDNPYSPDTQWDLWLRWDRDHGYYTNELIARVSNPSLDIQDDQELKEIYEIACDTILENDITGQYILVPSSDSDSNQENDMDS